MEYYNYIIILTWAALVLLCVLTFENARMTGKEKRSLYLTYLVVALAAMAECIGLWFNGDPTKPTWLLRMVKTFDYILTPIAGGALAAQLHQKTVLRKIMQGVLVVNVIFQIVAAFTGWMLVVDAENHYSHGPAYIAYIVLYTLIILLALVEFALYGQRFRKQNKASLYLTIVLALGGIAIQEFLGYRVAYLAIALAMAMMYIHNAEFVQLVADDSLREQRVQIMLSQIRPHFIYNSLSSISALCETDPKTAQELTDDFSEYLRSQLDAIETEKQLPFERVLEQVGFYVKLEQARFGDRVKVLYDIRVNRFSLPTMTLQPLVENAIRYGICKRETGGTVWISSYETESAYCVEIKDDGVGFDVKSVPSSGRSHIGIKNVRERLSTYGDSLEIMSKPGVGTTAKIVVPKGNSRENKGL
ncbi:MAG: histidine kinase [Clostridia bacterium]|nr:histidine kinase [Clostridia bacterium]